MDILQTLKDIETRLSRVEDELWRTPSQRLTRERRHSEAADSRPFAGLDHAHGYSVNTPTPPLTTHTDLLELCTELHTLIQSVTCKVQQSASNNESNTTANTTDKTSRISSAVNHRPATQIPGTSTTNRTKACTHTTGEDTATPSRASTPADADSQVERGTEDADPTQSQGGTSNIRGDVPRGDPAGEAAITAIETTQKLLSTPQWIPLDEEELGEALVPRIETLLNDQQPSTGGLRTLQLTSLQNMTRKMHLIRDAIGRLSKPKRKEPGTVYAMEYSRRKEPGILSLAAVGSKLEFPDYTSAPEILTNGEISTAVESLFMKPPTAKVVYYVGRPLTPHADGILHPGEKLLDLQKMAGVNSYYWQAGAKYSGTALHKEDANFRSINMVMHGYKLWVVIREAHTVLFEDFCRKLFYNSQRPCRPGRPSYEAVDDDQWLRHLNLLIDPRQLREQGILFDMFVAGPGQVVVTGHLQYHQVINLTDCFAISINFLPSYEPPLQVDIWTCSDCGLFHLRHEKIHRLPDTCKRCQRCGKFHLNTSTSQHATGQQIYKHPRSDQDQVHSRPTAKRMRPTAARATDVEENNPEHSLPSADDDPQTLFRHVIEQDPFSRYAEALWAIPDTPVARILLAVQSSTAVRNLADVIRGFKLECSRDMSVDSYFGTPAPTPSLRSIIQLARGCDQKSTTWSVLWLVAQIRLWRRVCELIGGQLNLTEHCWRLIAKDMGKDVLSESERGMVRKYRRTGRKVGEDLKGLIALIPARPLPPCGIQLSDLLGLSREQAKQLFTLINKHSYSKQLVEIGDSLVKSLEGGRGFRTCKWEQQPDLLERAITDLQREEVLNLMGPV